MKRIPFRFNNFDTKNKQLSEYIYSISKGKFYMVISRGILNSRGGENLQEILDYYIYGKYALNNSDLYFSKDFFPNYEIVLQSTGLGKEFYDILKIYDIESLDFFLSTAIQDDTIHIFSSDYDLNFIANIWEEYYDFIDNSKNIYIEDMSKNIIDVQANLEYIKDVIYNKTMLDKKSLYNNRIIFSYEYILAKHQNYISSKKFILYDTSIDDEDTKNYLFISSHPL